MSMTSEYLFAIECVEELLSFLEMEVDVQRMIDDELNSENNVEYGKLLAFAEAAKNCQWYLDGLKDEFNAFQRFENFGPDAPEDNE